MSDAIAIIPARGGSKRIPHKNIRVFHGKPILAWPIEMARKSGLFKRVLISTDDEKIAAAAEAAGAEVPFTREAKLANDFTGTTEVIRDAVMRLQLSPETPVCCLYATAVFARAEDLRKGLARLNGPTNWVFSVGAFQAPIERAYRMENGVMHPDQHDMMPKRSQDLAPAYFDAGQFYWARARTWADTDARVWDDASGVILPAERCVDIDTPEDWSFAERLFGLLQPISQE